MELTAPRKQGWSISAIARHVATTPYGPGPIGRRTPARRPQDTAGSNPRFGNGLSMTRMCWRRCRSLRSSTWVSNGPIRRSAVLYVPGMLRLSLGRRRGAKLLTMTTGLGSLPASHHLAGCVTWDAGAIAQSKRLGVPDGAGRLGNLYRNVTTEAAISVVHIGDRCRNETATGW